MESKQLRKRNFDALLREHKTLEALADRTGSNPRHLSQIKNGKPMGDKVARRFEEKLGKPHGWMDQMHDGQPTSGLAVTMLANFEALPQAFQEHIAQKTVELREHADSMPGYIRESLHRPADPLKWREWESQVEADMAAKKAARGADSAASSRTYNEGPPAPPPKLISVARRRSSVKHRKGRS